MQMRRNHGGQFIEYPHVHRITIYRLADRGVTDPFKLLICAVSTQPIPRAGRESLLWLRSHFFLYARTNQRGSPSTI
jgi:hypothetical protein